MIIDEKNYESMAHSDDTDDMDDADYSGIPTYFLTTVDNPFHPYKEYDDWYAFDHDKGYNTLEYLDRVSGFSEYLTEIENRVLTNKAIDEICRLFDFYKRVVVL